jgi:hypothetical protein
MRKKTKTIENLPGQDLEVFPEEVIDLLEKNHKTSNLYLHKFIEICDYF